MPRPNRSEQTRQALIETGIEQLSLHGYHGTGIKQILDVVGVPKGSFYHYFASKEAFVAEIIKVYSDTLLDRLDGYLAHSDEAPLDQIKNLYSQALEEFSGQDCQQGCLIGSIAAEIGNQSVMCQAAMLDAVRKSKSRVSSLIAQAQQAGQVRDDLTAEQLTTVFWAAWEGSLLGMKMEGCTESAKDTLFLMLDGLLKPCK